MKTFNPYLVDEIVAQSNPTESYFGLINNQEGNRAELHGYEITLSGKLVLPELIARPEAEEPRLIQALLW